MNDQQINGLIGMIAGAAGNYTGDYMALLNVLEHLGFVVTHQSQTATDWSATVSKGALTMTARGESLNHATCLAMLQLNDLILRNEQLIDEGMLRFREEGAPMAVAHVWLSDGAKVARKAWGEGTHLRLNRGTTRHPLNGTDMYGVPARFFDHDPQASVTRMPQFVLTNTEQLTTADWTPVTADLLASDWRLI